MMIHMQKIKIGTILYRARMEKGISEKLLCKGLCQISTISYYENNKRVPDSLLFYYFIQRLGMAPEDYAIMLSREEYGYFIWKEKTEQAIEKKEWENLQILLRMDEAIHVKCNERIQRQYYYYVRAILELQKYGNNRRGVEFLQMAAEQTIPDISNFSTDTIMLGTTELNILINYLYYGTLNQVLNGETSKELFWKLEKYISQGVMEKNEQAKVYPKLICILIEFLTENQKKWNC